MFAMSRLQLLGVAVFMSALAALVALVAFSSDAQGGSFVGELPLGPHE
jgi:hypothetical protein